jgi:hypothetical protein
LYNYSGCPSNRGRCNMKYGFSKRREGCVFQEEMYFFYDTKKSKLQLEINFQESYAALRKLLK